MSPELAEARRRLADCIAEVDRLAFGDRTDQELLTHWAVVYSHVLVDDDGDASQVSDIRSDGWQEGERE